MKNPKTYIETFIISVILIALVFILGCKSTLQNGGAYARGTNIVANGVTNFVATPKADLAFFQVDSAYDLAYTLAQTVFKAERDNRVLLWSVSHDIKHALDKARIDFDKISANYDAAREAYQKNPTPAGLTALQTYLGQAQQVSAAVQAVIPKSK